MALGGARPGAGRPKSKATLRVQAIRERIAEEFEKNVEPIVAKAMEQAREGNKDARDWITEHAIGRARQVVGLEGGEEGSAIEIAISEIIAKKNGLIQVEGETSNSEQNTANGEKEI